MMHFFLDEKQLGIMIRKDAELLSASLGKIELFMPKIDSLSSSLKKSRSSEKINELSKSVLNDSSLVVKEIDLAVHLSAKIAIHTLWLFEKSSRRLNNTPANIELKNEMKSIARQIYESLHAENLFDISSDIKKGVRHAGKAIEEVSGAIKSHPAQMMHLISIELKDIKKIQLEAIIARARLSRHLLHLKQKSRLLPKLYSEKLDRMLLNSEKRMSNARNFLTTKSAEFIRKIIK